MNKNKLAADINQLAAEIESRTAGRLDPIVQREIRRSFEDAVRALTAISMDLDQAGQDNDDIVRITHEVMRLQNRY